MAESKSRYYLRFTEKIPPGVSNSRPARRCDRCKGKLPKRHGFPSRTGRAILCGSCVRVAF